MDSLTLPIHAGASANSDPELDGLLRPTPEQPLSIADLSAYLKIVVEGDAILSQLWLTGEVSSAKAFPSGLYFTLKDPEAEAVITATIWRGQLARLTVVPTVGDRVIVLGQVQIWPKRGEYKLVVWQVLPAGAGLAALRLNQLRDRLAAEGLFDDDRKRPLPSQPQTIAVVTSRQAAAWGDIQQTLRDRDPGVRVLLAPAHVQGESAPKTLVAAIERVVADGRAEVLILARGGGATEDLSCFNDERLVRTLAACPIPTITGIGHQRDESLCDRVADLCAHTPTAAAERAVPSVSQLRRSVADRRVLLLSAFFKRLDRATDQLETLRHRLAQARPDRQLAHHHDQLAHLRHRAKAGLQQRLIQEHHRCDRLQQALAALDPAQVLDRGYAVVRHEASGAIVRDSQAVAIDDILILQLGTGQVRVRVESIDPVEAIAETRG